MSHRKVKALLNNGPGISGHFRAFPGIESIARSEGGGMTSGASESRKTKYTSK